MVRRWCILLAMLAMTAGAAFTASSASAATAGTVQGAFNPGGPVHLVGAVKASGGKRYQTVGTSTNWSGYVATGAKTYTSVSASWTQPTGTCSSSSRRGEQDAAFWVGLDGFTSKSVEQTGSEVACVGKTAQYDAWYEMYPGPSEVYTNTVQPGDQFNASVTYEGSNKFSLYIADTTQGWSHTATATLANAALSSAEVIVEAPTSSASGAILPLTDFGTVSITGSEANGAAVGNDSALTQLTMTESGNSKVDRDSVSSLSGGENFTATWLRSS
jgi:Peptidase A4 family